MALKPCRECKKEISTDAKTCPNCGKKGPHPPDLRSVAPWLVAGMVALVGYYGFKNWWSAPAIAPAAKVASAPPPVPPPPVATAPSISEQEYDGPLGLKWGESPDEVKKALSARLAFAGQHTVDDGQTLEQSYTGEFSGFPAKTIGVDFHDGKLEAFGVRLPERDVRPASKRWEEMVEQMTEAHGDPTNIARPPKKPGFSGAMEAYPETRNKAAIQQLAGLMDSYGAVAGVSGYPALDQLAKTGEWKPVAQWQFKNAMVVVALEVGQPDRHGDRSLTPMWLFMSNDGVKLASAAQKTDL